MVHWLRELGFTVHGFKADGNVGGTWYWNRYPGARCDSESMYYSYSFLPELEQEWPLEERYPGQPVILRYLQHVADRLALREYFTFSTRIAAATYDADANLWTLRHRGRHPVRGGTFCWPRTRSRFTEGHQASAARRRAPAKPIAHDAARRRRRDGREGQ